MQGCCMSKQKMGYRRNRFRNFPGSLVEIPESPGVWFLVRIPEFMRPSTGDKNTRKGAKDVGEKVDNAYERRTSKRRLLHLHVG